LSRPLLSAALIVRDEERFLEACLRSLIGRVDEPVVVDTGSTDRSCEIAGDLGAAAAVTRGIAETARLVPMTTPVLLVLTALRWFGAARMPRALAQAGFEVTLLTPPGSLAEKSSHIAKIAYLSESATPEAWVHAFAATAKATGARLALPCDDNALRWLQMLATSPPQGLQPTLHQELATLIADSLGNPAYYAAGVEPTLFPAAAAALGLRVPLHAIVSDAGGVESFGAEHGYPIVLKGRRKTAVVGSAQKGADVAATFASLSGGAAADQDGSRAAALVHVDVRGRRQHYEAVAWKGELLAGFAGERFPAEGGNGSQPAVYRYFRSDSLRKIAATLARGFGVTGLFSLEGVVAEGSGEFHLLDFNRRLVGGAHRGSGFGVDLCATLHSALQGTPVQGRIDLDEGEEHLCVAFPQEWLRDPESKWLRDYPVDVPWDEPDLFEAMLELPAAAR
jgi:hypothetical protein